MRREIIVALAIASSYSPAALPASAVAYKTSGSVSGGLTVHADFTVCASLTFASGTFTGVFAAVGQMQGPGTKVGTVRAAVPVLGTWGTWYDCIPGAYHGATAGEAKFVLIAAGSAGEYIEVQECVINGGAITCV